MVERFNGDIPYFVMTSAWPWLQTKEVIEESAKTGAQGIELLALNPGGGRITDKADHVAAHLDIPSFVQDPFATAKNLADILNQHQLGAKIGAYERIHSEKNDADVKTLDYMLRVIDFASALGGKDGGAFGVSVGMFWGWDRNVGVELNLSDISRKLIVLGRYAQDRNVMITSENCHMPGGWSPADDHKLPMQVLRSGGATLANRLYVADVLEEAGIKPGTLGFIWDPSHSETEQADPLVEAELSFKLEPNIAVHIKGHNPYYGGEKSRMAYFGGPALPGLFGDPKSKFYQRMLTLGVPISDNAWAQQYGRVTLPGVGDSCITPFGKIFAIARDSGFNGPAIAEDETPEKAEAVGRKDAPALTKMFSDCLAAVRPYLWQGQSYNGKPFKPLDVERQGRFNERLSWRQAVETYLVQPIPV